MSNKKISVLQNSKKGVALLMVIGAMLFLSAIIAQFTLETNLHKLRVYNSQFRIQARLNAESGVALAMARLLIYQNALNFLEKNPTYKQMIPQNIKESLWSAPFIYPIPLMKDANIIQRTALEDFKKNFLLEGELSVHITDVSGKLNVNNLRFESLTKEEKEGDLGLGTDSRDDRDLEVSDFEDINWMQLKLFATLKKKLEQKKEEDKNYTDKYKDNPKLLIKSLKYYVSSENSYEDSDRGELEKLYRDAGITPKFAPLSSPTELNAIPGFNDATMDLIREDLGVHGYTQIDFNKITKNILKFIFPELNEDKLKKFFEYRDKPESPHHFNTKDDVEKYFTETISAIKKEDFKKRMALLEKSGIRIGESGSVFKIISVGKYDRSVYTITVIVSLPIKEKKKGPICPKEPDQASGSCGKDCIVDPNDFNKCIPMILPSPQPLPNNPEGTPGGTSAGANPNPTPTSEPTFYLPPRAVEINLN